MLLQKISDLLLLLADFSFTLLSLGFLQLFFEDFLIALKVMLVLTMDLHDSGVDALSHQLHVSFVRLLVICRNGLEHFTYILV